MSLFKYRELWTFQQVLPIPDAKQEEFHQYSLTIGNVDNSQDGKDKIVTGSFGGVLRIFSPKEGKFLPTDALIERQFKSPILQVEIGRFIPGSKLLGLAVLFPRKISVFEVKQQSTGISNGKSIHNCQLNELYHHSLPRLAYNFCFGPFGGVYGKDFLCVQSFDGQLSFFEYERVMFARFLPNFLLPGCITYIRSHDSFITYNSEMKIQSIKYQTLVSSLGSSQKESEEVSGSGGKRVKIDWEINVGEEVYGIKVASYSKSLEANQYEILVLGERTLFTITPVGKISNQKRLDYFPSSFELYYNTRDTTRNKRQKIIIGTNSKSLMIYDDPKLIWSASMDYIPVCVKVGNFLNNDGMIVALSDSGRLSVGYLGTDPATKTVASIEKRDVDYVKLEKELQKLKGLIRKSMREGTLQSSQPKNIALEVMMPENIDKGVSHQKQVSFNLVIKYDGTEPILNLQVNLTLPEGFRTHKNCMKIPKVDGKEDPLIVPFIIYMPEEKKKTIISSLQCSFSVFFRRNNGEPNVTQINFDLPISMIGSIVTATPRSNFSFVIETPNVPPFQLNELFSDLIRGMEEEDSQMNRVVFKYYSGEDVSITSNSEAETGKYVFKASEYEVFHIFMREFLKRIKKKQPKVEFRTDKIDMYSFFQIIEKHFAVNHEFESLLKKLEMNTIQFRAIQKRLLVRYKDKNPTPLTGMDGLFELSYKEIMNISRYAEKKKAELAILRRKLSCATKTFVLSLIFKYNLKGKDVGILNSCFNPQVEESVEQTWEDSVFSSLTYLLQVLSKKVDFDREMRKVKNVKFLEELIKKIQDLYSKNFSFNKLSEKKKEKKKKVVV